MFIQSCYRCGQGWWHIKRRVYHQCYEKSLYIWHIEEKGEEIILVITIYIIIIFVKECFNPFIHGVSTLVVFHGGGSIWPNNFDTHFNTELYTLDFWNFIGIITGYIKSEKKIYPQIFLKGGGSIFFFFEKICCSKCHEMARKFVKKNLWPPHPPLKPPSTPLGGSKKKFAQIFFLAISWHLEDIFFFFFFFDSLPPFRTPLTPQGGSDEKKNSWNFF